MKYLWRNKVGLWGINILCAPIQYDVGITCCNVALFEPMVDQAWYVQTDGTSTEIERPLNLGVGVWFWDHNFGSSCIVKFDHVPQWILFPRLNYYQTICTKCEYSTFSVSECISRVTFFLRVLEKCNANNLVSVTIPLFISECFGYSACNSLVLN